MSLLVPMIKSHPDPFPCFLLKNLSAATSADVTPPTV